MLRLFFAKDPKIVDLFIKILKGQGLPFKVIAAAGDGGASIVADFTGYNFTNSY
jgi:hypothetical protein